MKKSELLNGLQEEYREWEALLDQIDPAREVLDESHKYFSSAWLKQLAKQ